MDWRIVVVVPIDRVHQSTSHKLGPKAIGDIAIEGPAAAVGGDPCQRFAPAEAGDRHDPLRRFDDVFGALGDNGLIDGSAIRQTWAGRSFLPGKHRFVFDVPFALFSQERLFLLLVGEYETELQVVSSEIDFLVEVVKRHGDGKENDSAIQAAAALYYLVNPYDDICDFYTDIGFTDDIDIIKRVYSRITECL